MNCSIILYLHCYQNCVNKILLNAPLNVFLLCFFFSPASPFYSLFFMRGCFLKWWRLTAIFSYNKCEQWLRLSFCIAYGTFVLHRMKVIQFWNNMREIKWFLTIFIWGHILFSDKCSFKSVFSNSAPGGPQPCRV